MEGKKRAILIGFLLAGLVLAFPLSTSSQSGIIVTGADSVVNTSSIYSSDLVSTTLSIGPRVAVEYAGSTGPHLLSNIPTELQGRVDSVSDRVAVEYAHSTAPHALIAVPSGLQALVDAVAKRVAVEYANSTRAEALVYPLALIGDTTPPQISDIAVSPAGSGSVAVSWTTDEFATSAVSYGTQPGAYSESVTDPLFTKQHGLSLSGIAPETTYYYQVRSTDRSGNTATGAERNFTLTFVYLPLVVRSTP